MLIEVNLPDIGVDKIEVTKIMVKVGDKININQSLIIVEDEKRSLEVLSVQAGIIKEIKISVGDKISTGEVIMLFDVEEKIAQANVNTLSDLNLNTSEINGKKVDLIDSKLRDVIMPDIGDDELEVTDIMVNIGDQISFEQSIITVEGEKASIEIPAPFAGIVKEIKITKGDKVKTGSLIMIFVVNETSISLINSNKIKNTTKVATKLTKSSSISLIPKINSISEIKNKFIENREYIYATPLIRRLSRKFGINLSKIKGTGRKGRILREDIQNYIKDAVKHFETEITTTNSFLPGILPWPNIDFSKFGEIEEVELSRIQKISSANLMRNWTMIPHVTIMEDIDITELEVFRKQQNKEMEKLQNGIKITPLVFVMKTVARALEKMPRFNSSISADAQRLTFKKYIHIGIAVDTPNGLVVPVIRDVNKKGIIELSKELIEVSKKARNSKLTKLDMQGGSFTISSLGSIGTTSFTPIINAPEVAIIGLSRSSIKPVWNGSEFISRLILPISLSFNHRVIDGADGARFITLIARLMTDIRCLIM